MAAESLDTAIQTITACAYKLTVASSTARIHIILEAAIPSVCQGASGIRAVKNFGIDGIKHITVHTSKEVGLGDSRTVV